MKVKAAGFEAVQLQTGGMCHLDAAMVEVGLDTLPLAEPDLVIIENVGNLVCPAEFDTGAVKNIGSSACRKATLMFTLADVLLINKIDSG